MSKNKVANRNGRRKGALERLEKKLQEWDSHNQLYTNHKGITRSHEAEKARIEQEIANIKAHLH